MSFDDLKSIFFKTLDDKKTAEVYANTFLLKAKKEKAPIKIADGYLYKSYISDFNNALGYTDSIVLLTKKIQDFRYPALGYMTKGHYYYEKGNDEAAIKSFITAYGYASKNNNEEQLIYLKQNIANIKFVSGDINGALKTYKQYLEHLEKTPNYYELYGEDYLYALDHISKAYLKKKVLDSASFYIDKGIHLSLKNNNNDFYYSFLLNSGTLNYFKKNYDIALDSLNKSKPHLKDMSLLMNYYYSGKIHENSNVKKTINNYIKIDSIYSTIKVPSFEIHNVYKTLFEYYTVNGSEKKQLYYVNKLIEVDSILRTRNRNIDNDILRNHEIPKLREEKRRLENRFVNSTQKSQITIFWLAIIIILFFILIVVLYFKQKSDRKKYIKIINNVESPSLNINISKIAENNSLNIAQDIIDEILLKLNHFESNESYVKAGITLNSLSKDFGTNSSYLSKIINQYRGQSFSNYLNSIRIEYAIILLLNNSKFRNYTISAIANEVGFNTSESFSKAFFKEKGIYPSYFIKQLKKDKSN